VSSDQGAAFARAHGCLYKETSAKEDCGGVEEGVYDALVWGMVATILDTPGLVGRRSRRGNGQLDLGGGSSGGGRRGGCC
jgi:Ras-related protein Rab-18